MSGFENLTLSVRGFSTQRPGKKQANAEERSDDQRKLKITNLALEDYK